MKTISIKELKDKKLWKKFCKMRDLDIWDVEKGWMDNNDRFIITKKEAKKLGLIKQRRKNER